ncbi:MAG: aldehyde dehydrogenase, partial [Armatimonadota bacterium]
MIRGGVPPPACDSVPARIVHRRRFAVREPLGVVSAILAFNLPLAHAAQTTAPAIAAGNAIILKPSREAPLTVLRLGLLLHRAGVPEEALSILTGIGEEIGYTLAAHTGVNLLSFIGSREVGVTLSAGAGNKRIEMELESFSVVLAT